MYKINRLAPIVAIALILAGCGLPGVPTPGGGLTLSGPCANQLYPVLAGATWTYELTGTTSDTITRSIASVSADGFADQDTFASGAVRTGQWNCDAGALTALDPVGSTSATVQRNGEIADFHTTALDGVTLPASVVAGTAWSQTISIAGTLTVNGKTADATNDTSLSCTANGMENVTVPAGSFDAMKVTCQNSVKITVTLQGITVPVPEMTFTSQSWYAPGVGMVKSVASGDGLDTTTSLTSYSLP
jgi:hypothetical protein